MKSPRSTNRLIMPMLLLLSLAPGYAAALSITNVQHPPGVFNPPQDHNVAVRYRLSDPAQVSLKLYDQRDLLIRQIDSEGLQPPGDNRLSWDGKDQAGVEVPADAYRYTLTATGQDGQSVTHDVSELSGGETLKVKAIQWDAQAGQIRYVLPKAGRVIVRLGIQDFGPLMRTVIQWVARPGGVNAEPWDGKDASGQLDLSAHPKLEVRIEAFALSDNSIIVGQAPEWVQLIKKMSWAAQQRQATQAPAKARKLSLYANQPVQIRQDFVAQLSLPQDLPLSASGEPLVQDTVAVVVDAAPNARQILLAQRFEIMFFVDGRFAFEAEKGYLPFTWQWNPTGSNPGVHYITANLLGYEGSFGTYTVKVTVQPKP